MFPYSFLVSPFIALFLAQFIKVIIESKKGKFSWKAFDNYGGMPSSHTAIVGAIVTEVFLAKGLNSISLAIATVFAFLVVRDAVGIRRILGKQAEMINALVRDLPDKEEGKYPFLVERLGHTYPQVIVGGLLGIIIALIL